MRNFLLVIPSFLFSSSLLLAQVGYEVSRDTKDSSQKVLKGTINKYILQKDSALAVSYNSSQKSYAPDSPIVKAFTKNWSGLYFVLFGGTWCDDTQLILPRFFMLQEMAKIPDDHIAFYGVDRSKKTLGHIAEAFGITNVPTIIVMKDGKEMGRVVEFGKTGKWDQELAEIISAH